MRPSSHRARIPFSNPCRKTSLGWPKGGLSVGASGPVDGPSCLGKRQGPTWQTKMIVDEAGRKPPAKRDMIRSCSAVATSAVAFVGPHLGYQGILTANQFQIHVTGSRLRAAPRDIWVLRHRGAAHEVQLPHRSLNPVAVDRMISHAAVRVGTLPAHSDDTVGVRGGWGPLWRRGGRLVLRW